MASAVTTAIESKFREASFLLEKHFFFFFHFLNKIYYFPH